MIQSINYQPTPREVAAAITRKILQVADSSTAPLRVAISGGSTPASLFAYWLENPREIISRGIHFWWVDERMVPQESKDSNYGNAYRQFFTAVTYPEELLHPISYTGATTETRTEEYNNEFEGVDIAILGMGTDGHTSSLFPGQDLFDKTTSYIHSIHPTNGIERVALSYKGIVETPLVLFHVLGINKKDRLQEVISLSRTNESESRALPAAYAMYTASKVEVYTDIEGLNTQTASR